MEKRELIKAAECGLAWVDEQRQRKRDESFHELLENMCARVIDSNAESLSFYVKQIVNDPREAESGKIKPKLFGKFEAKYATFSDSISQFAKDRGFDFIPKVEISKTGKANVGTFGASHPLTTGQISKGEVPTGAIRYTFDEKHNLWRGFGFLAGMKLSIWPFLIVVVALLAFGAFMVWWSSLLVSHVIAYPTSGSFLLAFGTLLLVLVLWRRYRAFDRFLTTKIALVHDALASFSAPQSVAWLKNTDREYPTIEVISASATCPICDGEIRLRKPHFECSHEVIGACRNNPTEHCFSFDPTTRLGWPITEVARRHHS